MKSKMKSKSKTNKSEQSGKQLAKQIAKQHWGHIRKLLVVHSERPKVIKKLKFTYHGAFVHGFKHGVESAKRKCLNLIEIFESQLRIQDDVIIEKDNRIQDLETTTDLLNTRCQSLMVGIARQCKENEENKQKLERVAEYFRELEKSYLVDVLLKDEEKKLQTMFTDEDC